MGVQIHTFDGVWQMASAAERFSVFPPRLLPPTPPTHPSIFDGVLIRGNPSRSEDPLHDGLEIRIRRLSLDGTTTHLASRQFHHIMPGLVDPL